MGAVLRAMMKEYSGEEPTDEMLANSFTVMDEDGSGDIIGGDCR